MLFSAAIFAGSFHESFNIRILVIVTDFSLQQKNP